MIRKPMRSTLAVTTKATDLTLLTEAERREAAGLAADDASKDALLLALDQRIAAAIMSECNIAIGSGAEPTLKQEVLTETFYSVHLDRLLLSRRHNVAITSLTDCESVLTTDDYIVDPEAGILTRMRSGCPSCWRSSKVIVVYEAGFETVPADLKFAAMDFFRSEWLARSRDPLVKRVQTDVFEVESTTTDYWVGSVPGQSREGAVPDIVSGQLKRFRNVRV
ncbi:hypothetical protein [Rhizobium chutanense]|uniref:Phage gp6-like head-tail connector protein n=1 Tax=Rhizobium chutanense TaxID=2035448 RepID=A0A432P412_9HYPH|nr:hypothetical protein [Rhizobium chutanense]RUM06813.1 hypothetical protein EFR84_11490 [Rhizobium chutanense]